MPRITLEMTLAQTAGTLSSVIDDEMILMGANQDKYFGLNVVSRSIWEALDGQHSLNSVCEGLMEKFDVDASTCRADVLEYAQQLADAGLVRVVDQ